MAKEIFEPDKTVSLGLGGRVLHRSVGRWRRAG